MYDLDDDFAGSFNAKKIAEKAQTPFLPFAEGTFGLTLKRVKRDKSPKKGKYFEFKFVCTKSNNDNVVKGASYVLRFNQGASDVSNEICWSNMLPILMAAMGTTDILNFDAPKVLGEFLALSKGTEGAPGADLDFEVVCKRRLEAAKPNKDTGKVDPKNLNEDGSVKKYPRDEWAPGTAGA